MRDIIHQFKKFAPIAIFLVIALVIILSKGFIVNNLGLKRYAIELFQSGEFGKSVPELEKVVSNEPGDHESRAMLALSYMFTGKVKDAEAQYEVIMKESPDNPEVLYKLGLANHSQGRHDKAAEILKMAVDKGTSNTIINEQLIDCYVRIKDYAGAREQIYSLLKDENMGSEKKAFAMERIGDLFAEENKNAEAKEAYEKALSFENYYRIREKRDSL